LRGRISQLRKLIDHIDGSALEHSDALRKSGSEDDFEMQRRSAAVSNLSEKLRICESQFYDNITFIPVQNDHTRVPSPSAGQLGRSQLQDEDDQLDQILGTATHLKEIGYEINDEILVHVRLLDEIDAREDALFSQQRANERLLGNWMATKSRSTLTLWGLVCVLFLIFIYVLF
jgi:hypothetical protein